MMEADQHAVEREDREPQDIESNEEVRAPWQVVRTSAVMAVLSIALGWYAIVRVDDYPEVARRAPFVMAVTLVVVAAIIALRDVVKLVVARRAAEVTTGRLANFLDGSLRRFLITVLFTAYVVALPAIGFILATVAVTLLSSVVLGMRRPWYAPPLLAVGFTAASYLAFVHLFAVRLP